MTTTRTTATYFMSNLLTAVAVIYLKRDFQQSMGYGQFILHNNSYLDVPKLRSKNITDRRDCAISCVILPHCLSYNLASTSTNGKYLCEILETDKYRNPSNFKVNASFQHYGISSQCTRNPCHSPTACIPNYNDGSFKCVPPEDCAAVYKAGERQSSVYTVDPDGKGTMNVYCDMVTDGGGWTVVQRRVNGSVDFYRDWTSYKHGFGSLSGEFWLGNENIHRLTSSGNSVLRIELEDWDGSNAHANYGTFDIGDEKSKYKLTVGSYSGTAGDSLSYHNGMRFSTFDQDNDDTAQHCAKKLLAAWWFNSCKRSNLNGGYLGNVMENKGITWSRWRNTQSMKSAQMKIRHV